MDVRDLAGGARDHLQPGWRDAESRRREEYRAGRYRAAEPNKCYNQRPPHKHYPAEHYPTEHYPTEHYPAERMRSRSPARRPFRTRSRSPRRRVPPRSPSSPRRQTTLESRRRTPSPLFSPRNLPPHPNQSTVHLQQHPEVRHGHPIDTFCQGVFSGLSSPGRSPSPPQPDTPRARQRDQQRRPCGGAHASRWGPKPPHVGSVPPTQSVTNPAARDSLPGAQNPNAIHLLHPPDVYRSVDQFGWPQAIPAAAPHATITPWPQAIPVTAPQATITPWPYTAGMYNDVRARGVAHAHLHSLSTLPARAPISGSATVPYYNWYAPQLFGSAGAPNSVQLLPPPGENGVATKVSAVANHSFAFAQTRPGGDVALKEESARAASDMSDKLQLLRNSLTALFQGSTASRDPQPVAHPTPLQPHLPSPPSRDAEGSMDQAQVSKAAAALLATIGRPDIIHVSQNTMANGQQQNECPDGPELVRKDATKIDTSWNTAKGPRLIAQRESKGSLAERWLLSCGYAVALDGKCTAPQAKTLPPNPHDHDQKPNNRKNEIRQSAVVLTSSAPMQDDEYDPEMPSTHLFSDRDAANPPSVSSQHLSVPLPSQT